MSYATVEAALLTLIQGMTDYDTNNTSQSDYRILGHGKAQAVVLTPGAFTRSTASPQWHRTRWTINIEMYSLFTGDINTAGSTMRSKRQDIIDEIDKYPTLNDTSGVVLARITGGSEYELWSIHSKQYWVQILTCEIEERTVITYS